MSWDALIFDALRRVEKLLQEILTEVRDRNNKYLKKSDVIAYIRKEAKEAQSAFDELGGESGIIAEAFEDLANELEDFPTADVATVRHGK